MIWLGEHNIEEKINCVKILNLKFTCWLYVTLHLHLSSSYKFKITIISFVPPYKYLTFFLLHVECFAKSIYLQILGKFGHCESDVFTNCVCVFCFHSILLIICMIISIYCNNTNLRNVKQEDHSSRLCFMYKIVI
jgi:hypothetical protein